MSDPAPTTVISLDARVSQSVTNPESKFYKNIRYLQVACGPASVYCVDRQNLEMQESREAFSNFLAERGITAIPFAPNDQGKSGFDIVVGVYTADTPAAQTALDSGDSLPQELLQPPRDSWLKTDLTEQGLQFTINSPGEISTPAQLGTAMQRLAWTIGSIVRSRLPIVGTNPEDTINTGPRWWQTGGQAESIGFQFTARLSEAQRGLVSTSLNRLTLNKARLN